MSSSGWTDRSDGTGCGDGKVCVAGSCFAGCLVGGALQAPGALDPMNACAGCQPDQSIAAWTPLADGAECAMGSICGAGTCMAGCFVDGAVRAPAALDPNNGCQVCDPAVSTGAWTVLGDGAGCGAGKVCAEGACAAGCFIDGAARKLDELDPDNACRSCQPAKSTKDWTNLANGAACGNAQVCANGSCGTSCVVAGMTYLTGVTNPQNACESCQPGKNSTGFSALANGTACGNGKVCKAAACIAGCFIGGVVQNPSALRPGNSCQICLPGTSTVAWSSVPNGTPCAGGVCSKGACVLTPAVISATPACGSNAGGASAAIVGNRFAPGAAVRFAGVAAAPVTVVSTVQIIAKVPAVPGKIGIVPVSVTNAGGNAASANVFTYYRPATFGAPISSSVLGMSTDWIIAADVNGDGLDDVVTSNYVDSSWSVLVNRGDGTFKAGVTYMRGGTPLAAGDFNKDGKLDIAIGDGGGVAVHLGNGDGTFKLGAPVGAFPRRNQGVTVADFNGDGKLDAAASIGINTIIAVFLGNGDGTLKAPTTFPVGNNPTGIVSGDWNGDGARDLAVENYADGTVGVLLGRGDGTFRAAVNYTVGGSPNEMSVADIDKDGKRDLVLSLGGHFNMAVLLGSGDGTFKAAIKVPRLRHSSGAAVADYNGDGDLDIASATADKFIEISFGAGDGTFPCSALVATTAATLSITDGNFNGGRRDLAASMPSLARAGVLLNTTP